MNKKFLGITIGSIVTVIACLAAAFAFWLFVEINSVDPSLLLASLNLH